MNREPLLPLALALAVACVVTSCGRPTPPGDSQYEQAKEYHDGDGVPLDKVKAFQLYREAAELGHAEAQYAVASYYHDGDGEIEQDHGKAREWFLKAASQGHAKSQFNIGVMFHLGRGGSVDHFAAAEWYGEAAEQGHREAQYNLASLKMMRVWVSSDGRRIIRQEQ